MTATQLLLAALAAFAAGMVNAIAGGGSLITFPALVALGLPTVAASVTNTVAMCPGYFGAAIAQRRDLSGQRARMLRVLPVAAAGGALGALLLVTTGDRAFAVIVPFLLLIASLLLGFGDAIKRWLLAPHRGRTHGVLVVVAVGLASTYGGYFGAAMGVMILAALAIGFDDSLVRINALKQTISLVVNVVAALAFIVLPDSRARIPWPVVLAMMIGALAGGALGGVVASRVSPRLLRIGIVTLGLSISAVYFVRLI
jgi:uncharacterized protein